MKPLGLLDGVAAGRHNRRALLPCLRLLGMKSPACEDGSPKASPVESYLKGAVEVEDCLYTHSHKSAIQSVLNTPRCRHLERKPCGADVRNLSSWLFIVKQRLYRVVNVLRRAHSRRPFNLRREATYSRASTPRTSQHMVRSKVSTLYIRKGPTRVAADPDPSDATRRRMLSGSPDR